MIVLDASVALKWYVQEEDTDKALEILHAHVQENLELNFPDLVFYEIANAVRYSPSKNPKDIEDILKSFGALRVNVVIPTVDMLAEAGSIAFRHGISVYDAIYVALANELGCEFVTADEKLFRKIRSLKCARLLSKYSHNR